MKRRFWNWLVLLSHTLNVLVFDGDPQESLSARSYREGRWTEPYIDWLLGDQHCREAHIDERIHARHILEGRKDAN